MDDNEAMQRAEALAAAVRGTTSPNPWVGCVIEAPDGTVFEGATSPPGGPHAEAVALAAAGEAARGGTAWVTLEPCAHLGRTPPCDDAMVAAGLRRVVIALEDPDERVSGRGVEVLREAGIEVEVGPHADEVRRQLAPYLKHRSSGRPYVVLKLAATLDGRTAAPDGSSQWITGGAARADSHQLRAMSDAIVVGAGTVRADDPSLTVRSVEGRDPLRVVLGQAPPEAKVHPALEFSGDLGDLLDELGRRGVLQLLVEGGATVAGDFHRAGLVDHYAVYLAPAIFGGDDARPMFAGQGAATMADIWRGRMVGVQRLGDDLRIDVEPAGPNPVTGQIPLVPSSLPLGPDDHPHQSRGGDV
ncbi:MAG: ribD [Acidimicrobiales bacterium]|nr:ribD [Acidimicrobiales bacterium]